jgi:uncharacterized damage-inducible protein DinB
MTRALRLIVALALALPVTAVAQQPGPQASQPVPDNPLSTYLKNGFNSNKTYIIKSAEKMAEADYAFKPAGVAADVRTFGQLLGHIADANYAYCSRAKGEPNPNKQKHETIAAKAGMVKALNDAFAYCETVYDSMTDAKALEMMTVQGRDNSTRQVLRSAPLMGNIAHNNEHYGNLVTYLRAKGIVPPSSERGSE